MPFKMQGIIAAMVTPFTKNGEQVDYAKIGGVADALIKAGVSGLFPGGTTGEGSLQTIEEREGLLEETIDVVGKRADVIAHTGAPDYWTTLQLTEHAAESGAKAAAIITPGFYKYDDRGLVEYYATIAKAVAPFPIVLYNLPGFTGNNLSAEVIVRLAEAQDNIVGIKDSSGNMTDLSRILVSVPKKFQVCNGCDPFGYQALLAGADGAVSGTANVAAEIYVKVYKDVQAGKLKAAWKAQTQLIALCEVLQYGNHLGRFKEAMRLRGIDGGYVRPPQRELSAAEKKQLAKAMEAAGLI